MVVAGFRAQTDNNELIHDQKKDEGHRNRTRKQWMWKHMIAIDQNLQEVTETTGHK